MTPDTFRAWRDRLGLTQEAAADALGVSRRQIIRYEQGETIPKAVALACAQIEHLTKRGT